MNFLLLKSLHLISMVVWFSGLFYLPRLFVYHRMSEDQLSLDRFQVMEYKLYYFITTPGALATTLTGLLLLMPNMHYYMGQPWMHIKLTLIAILWGFHFVCGYFRKRFKQDAKLKSHRFFRVFNEIPTLILCSVIPLVVMKPMM
jgi:protoporphyrinogen IX oxidase